MRRVPRCGDACRAATIGVDASTDIKKDRTSIVAGWREGKQEPTGTSPAPLGLLLESRRWELSHAPHWVVQCDA